jgi:hypothetical protein
MCVALSRSEARRVLSLLVKWARSVEAIGLVREIGGMLWNMVPVSRWALTRHLSVGGVERHDMMDSVGQWEYVVEMVPTCARAMWPQYLGLFLILCRWQTLSCVEWALREGRPYPRSKVGRWRAVRGRLRAEETAERSARHICPSRVSSWESV